TITHFFAKRLIKGNFVGLPNIVAGRSVVPEFLQEQANADLIAKGVIDVFNDKEKIAKELKDIRSMLGQAGATDKVASIACSMIG
ncbi:MAG: lipid-A-disaccharide synthase, partial [Deltaproteobacteria bacterium]